ncbi:MAG TPA: ribonuclease HII [Candidatus Omnitrophica bacterium]|nr:ribonuclease HII [Candidatus Omnitrophota bacterium]
MPEGEANQAQSPLFDFDRLVISSGRWAGVDEAGRGPLAGPVVAAAVVVIEPEGLSGLNDSKKVTPKKRKMLYGEIIARQLVGIGFADEKEIDSINILQASLLAMKRAVLDLPLSPDGLLIDGTFTTDLPLSQKTIIGGDAKSASIAAASIVAKVIRDSWMEKMEIEYPEYGFAQHKGYGTALHLQALQDHGACVIHRRSFDPVRRVCFGSGTLSNRQSKKSRNYEN